MKKNKTRKATSKRLSEVKVYDNYDTSTMINKGRQLKFEDIYLELPNVPPTQVISIRLPSTLLNEIKSLGSKSDIPYQALIKLFLSEAVQERKKQAA